MREGAGGAVLNSFLPPLNELRLPRTAFPKIKGAEAEKAVHFLYSLMTGIILTISICKKTIGIIHFIS
jgi:hypothetical protein